MWLMWRALKRGGRRRLIRLPRPAPSSTPAPAPAPRHRRCFSSTIPANGSPGLKPEESFGYDAGIDQSLFNGRVVASVTGFSNDFSNLINFVSSTPMANPCRGIQTGCYVNVARAETSGLEVGTTIDVLPGLVKFTAAYTYLHAIDLATGLVLARRPKNLANFRLTITPTDRWLIEPRVLTVFQALQQRRPDQPGRRLYPRRSLYRVQDRQELEGVCAR